MSKSAEKSKVGKWLLIGCLAPLLGLTSLFISLAVWKSMDSSEPEAPSYITNAAPSVERKLRALKKKVARDKTPKNQMDLDQTVMALFSIEKALAEAKTFEGLTPYVLQKEPELVAPDVAALKYRFFNIYKNLLNVSDEIEEARSIYDITAGALSDLAGVVGYDSISGIMIDREQAKKVWEKRLAETEADEKLKRRLRKIQGEMLDFLFDFAKIRAKHIKNWNKLCAARDRAYLAVYERDWDEVVASASAAAAMAPHETEAHVFLVKALLERGDETDADSAKAILNDFIKKHQGQQAPAYLLRGVMELNDGDLDAAILDFDQAAAYYPKQQQAMSDRLNLYKKRLFLNKSKEGRMIVNLYRGMMSGSGYFSPDFQKARVFLKKGDKRKTRKKIFDHFFRRRLQGQWDMVLQDFRFCQNYLKSDFDEIFKGDDLRLKLDPAWFRNTLIVSIKNNGNQPVHNLTLLLCVRFTDMFKGDYVSFPIGDSVAVLRPGEQVEVGRKNISGVTREKLGTEKKWKDIIEYGAVLISDELIAWVAPKTPLKIKESSPNANRGKNGDAKSSKRSIKEQAKTAAKIAIDAVIDKLSNDETGKKKNNDGSRK
ncbi:MAG: hypothetical protein GXP32_00855 [Kiritimatiellaeota bacterium]|nr:hypothetical protein [Kiritimatiellota bacterium]